MAAFRLALGALSLSLILTSWAKAQVTTVDSVGDVGAASSFAIGSDGLGLISYYDRSNLALKVAHCSDAACATATLSTLDVAGNSVTVTALAVGTDGLGLIAYYDAAAKDLKVAHCSDLACTSALITPIDTDGDVGSRAALVIGSDGLGLIAYHDGTHADLKVAHCEDVACTHATLATLDSAATVVPSMAVAIGTDGQGLISYSDNANTLRTAHCENVSCTMATLRPLDTGSGSGIAIGTDGRPLVSYTSGGQLKVAHCADPLCISAAFGTVDSSGTAGGATLAIGPDGVGLIAYYDSSLGQLRVAHCGNLACTGATTSVVDGSWLSGAGSFAFDADGRATISYYQGRLGDLRVARCWNADCRYVDPAGGDANGDGLGDILARRSSGEVRVLASTSTAFTNAQWSNGFVSHRYDVYFADATGDGRADLISRNKQTGDVGVFASTGSAFAYSAGNGPGGTWSWGWVADQYDLYFADVTGDGKADLVGRVRDGSNSGGWAAGDLYVFPSTGTGFSSLQSSLWSYGWSIGYELYLADVNGDGRADVVSRYSGTPELTGDVYVALSSGSHFAFSGRWTYGVVAGYVLHFADVDGDHRADVVMHYMGPNPLYAGNVYVMFSTGTQFVWPFPGGTMWDVEYAWVGRDLVARDFNGEGKADLAIRYQSSGVVHFARNYFTGFDTPTAWTAGVDANWDLR